MGFEARHDNRFPPAGRLRYILPPMACSRRHFPRAARELFALCGMMLAGIVLGAASGCASGPAIKAVRAERVASTDEATELRVTLELTNPNESPLELTEWEYSAVVNGRTVYQGMWVAALTLPAGVPMTAELPVVVSAADTTDWATAKWTMGGSVGYRATRQIDRLLYQLGINRLSAGFDVRGDAVTEAPKRSP